MMKEFRQIAIAISLFIVLIGCQEAGQGSSKKTLTGPWASRMPESTQQGSYQNVKRIDREALLKEGAVPFTKDELVTLVSGKTEPWSQGAGYYEADGTLYALWDGDQYVGTWMATEDGKICHSVEEWGDIPCTEYFHKEDSIVDLYKGEVTMRSMEDYQEGNKLTEH